MSDPTEQIMKENIAILLEIAADQIRKNHITQADNNITLAQISIKHIKPTPTNHDQNKN